MISREMPESAPEGHAVGYAQAGGVGVWVVAAGLTHLDIEAEAALATTEDIEVTIFAHGGRSWAKALRCGLSGGKTHKLVASERGRVLAISGQVIEGEEGEAGGWARRHRSATGRWELFDEKPHVGEGRNYHLAALIDGRWVRVMRRPSKKTAA